MSNDNLVHLQEMRQAILNQMPPESHFTAADSAVLDQHREMMKSWTPEIVQGFYDMLYAHAPTAEIFHEGERPKVEQTLVDWWHRVVNGPRDDQFWDWMTFVGLVHVVRQVKNPMMIAAWSFVEDQAIRRSSEVLSPEQASEFHRAMGRFGKTFNALVAESYIIHYLQAVSESTGSSSALLDRLVMTEIGTMLDNVKGHFR